MVLGVLIALGVNEARERWRDHRKADTLGEALLMEYEANCRRFTDAAAYHEPLLAEMDSVIALNPDETSPQAMPSATNGLGPVVPSTAVYETARATGDISLLGFRAALGLGNVEEVTTLYRQSLGRVIDAFSVRGARLADIRQPYLLMREMQRGARSAQCSAYAALAHRQHVPVDSALMRDVGGF